MPSIEEVDVTYRLSLPEDTLSKMRKEEEALFWHGHIIGSDAMDVLEKGKRLAKISPQADSFLSGLSLLEKELNKQTQKINLYIAASNVVALLKFA